MDRRPERRGQSLAFAAGLVLAFAAATGILIGAVAAITVAPAPPATPAPAPIAWPAPAPTGLARNTALTPVTAAPPIRLTDQDGKPFDLASLRGTEVVIFFGYTHCPDVCPTSLADVRDAYNKSPVKFKVVFVTIDPARDDTTAMKQYVDYFKAGFIGLTGDANDIRQVADDWGIQYARIDGSSANGYSMAHTADAFLLDAAGNLRHQIWFGAGPDVFVDRVTALAAETPVPPAVTPAPSAPLAAAVPTPAPGGTQLPESSAPPENPITTQNRTTEGGLIAVLQSTVIRVGMNRVVFATSDSKNRELARPENAARVVFRSPDDPTAAPIEADAHQVWVNVGARGSWVVDASFPHAGTWTATISVTTAAGPAGHADLRFKVKERGSTPAVGDPLPSVRTPVGADWEGRLANISTDIYPDPDFYRYSVDQLLAAHRPFVLILYSPAFCPTTACGPLLKNSKVVAEEFPDMPFVHVEPYKTLNYGNRLVADYGETGLTFNEYARTFGIPVDPFVFVVDANGKVASSFELIVGMDELRTAIRAALATPTAN